MNILIAPDKFKGSLNASKVCEAIKEGLLQKDPSLNIICIPMADGGDGTCELLTNYFSGERIQKEVLGPQFESIKADYGISKDGSTAFIDVANASGLQLVKPENRNPLYTTTVGTGELILNALNRGVKKIVLGVGGSATNDAGMGMAQALGFEFYDLNGLQLKPIGGNLIHLGSIQTNRAHPDIKKVEFVVLCDVDNPLFGPQGAAYIYSPQKGAKERDVKLLDEGLKNFESVVQKTFKTSANFPGAGAGGGLPGGAKVFLNSSIQHGVHYIIEATQLEDNIKKADLVITGEGKIDEQTLSGKVVKGVADLANKYNKPVFAFTGSCALTEMKRISLGIKKIIQLVSETTTEKEAIENAFLLLKKRVMDELFPIESFL